MLCTVRDVVMQPTPAYQVTCPLHRETPEARRGRDRCRAAIGVLAGAGPAVGAAVGHGHQQSARTAARTAQMGKPGQA